MVTRASSTFTHPTQKFPFGPKHLDILSPPLRSAELNTCDISQSGRTLAVKLDTTAPMLEQTPGDEVLPAAEYVPDVSSRPGPDFRGMESSGSQTAGRSASGRSESAHVDTRDRRAPRPTRARRGDASGPLSSNRRDWGTERSPDCGGSEKLRAEKVQTGPSRRLQALGGCLRMSFRGKEAF